MIGPAVAGALFALTLFGRVWNADIVTLKNGREIEGLVVETGDEQLTLLRAPEGVLQTWRLTRTDIVSIQLSAPDVAGFRAVARRLEADRLARESCDAWRRICVLKPEGVPDQL